MICKIATIVLLRPTKNFIGFIQLSIVLKIWLSRFLGDTFNPRLKFDKHIDKISAKALKLLGFIKQSNKQFRNLYTTIQLFNLIVSP